MTVTEEDVKKNPPVVIQSFPKIMVPPRGPENSPFVIVGEAPGKEEIKSRKPFIGPSGVVLQHALNFFDKDNYPEPYILNVVPHLISGDKDADLLQELALEYREQLLEKIAKHPRKVILALGNVAVWALTGNISTKITQIRGKVIPSELSEHGIMPSTHPAYLLRGNGSFRQFKIDIHNAIKLSRDEVLPTFVPPTWEIIDNHHKLDWFIGQVKKHKGIVAGDYETGGFNFQTDKLLMGGFSLDGKHVYIIPGTKDGWMDGRNNFCKHLAPLWDIPSEQVQYCWHNGKFDIKFSHTQNQELCRVDEDTMLMSYALDETGGVHDLESVAFDWLHSPNWKKILDGHKKKGESYEVIPTDILVKYLAYDVANTYRLAEILKPLVSRDKASRTLYEKTLIPASGFLTTVEKTGLRVDIRKVKKNERQYRKRADGFNTQLNQIAVDVGYGPINPNSPAQVADLLYNTLEIKSKDRGTGAKILESLPPHPAIDVLLKYRNVNKGLTTYVTPVRAKVSIDGRIHPTYLLHGTATGRLACRDPNVQNIPREPKLRGQFIPRKGYCFIEVDLNQAELRSLAALSGDEALCNIYVDPNSKGLHEEVRADLYGYAKDWSQEELDKYMKKWFTDKVERVLEEQKMRSKNVNFGIVYGITAAGLSEQIEDTPIEAKRMLDGWARKFPDAWAFINKCREAPLRAQNLVTVFGHKKRFQIVSRELLTAQQNEAANFPHQSTASTITIHGGMRTQKRLKEDWDASICNLVHDSLLIEAPDDPKVIVEVSDYVIATLEQVPIDWGITRIPFKADAKVGRRWGKMVSRDKYLAQRFAS